MSNKKTDQFCIKSFKLLAELISICKTGESGAAFIIAEAIFLKDNSKEYFSLCYSISIGKGIPDGIY